MIISPRYCPPKLATLGAVWGAFSAAGRHSVAITLTLRLLIKSLLPGIFVGSVH
jgi:hypothetical protein